MSTAKLVKQSYAKQGKANIYQAEQGVGKLNLAKQSYLKQS